MESNTACNFQIIRDKRSPYDQYYFGEKNELNQKNGFGENHWTGPESLEWYTGNFVHDTMHGEGDYRWRFKDPDGAFVTFEGRFYANKMHGYGVMSYADGKVFTGLYYDNVRWGPGVEQMPSLQCNVGLWRGTQLARLCWAPLPRSVPPDLGTGPGGPSFLNPFRIILTEQVHTIGETNSAVNLLKEAGADPVIAHEIWPKMYPSSCNDPASALFHKNLFDYKYYKGNKYTLEERCAGFTPECEDSQKHNVAEYYAWNNNQMMLHMMKHAFQHDKQRSKVKLGLTSILNGPRKRFRPAGKHESDCRIVLMASYLGHVANVAQLVNEADVFADIADIRGNTALMYAVCGNKAKIIKFLVGAGANVNSYNDSCCTPLGIALLRYIIVANDIGADRLAQAVLPPVDKDAVKAAAALAKLEKDSTLGQPTVAMEWHIVREGSPERSTTAGTATPKLRRPTSLRNLKMGSSRSSLIRKRSDSLFKSRELDRVYESDDKIGAEDKMVSIFMKGQYSKSVMEFYQPVPGNNEPQYLFAINESMLAAAPGHLFMGLIKEQKPANLNPMKSQLLWENHLMDGSSLDSTAKHKHDLLTEIQLTIMDLLELGADPKLVVCPQPAVLLALKTRNPDIVRHMVSHGADINQQYPDLYNLTVLDMVVTEEDIGPESLEMLQALLSLGADAQHRVPVIERLPSNTPISPPPSPEGKPDPSGPTLLHMALNKHIEFDEQEEIIEKMLQQLLNYHCDPTAQYLGSSAIDTAMMMKFHLLHVFITNPCTDLNGIINNKNQTILMKLFSKDFFREIPQTDMIPTLTNLLLYGADPLLEGQNEDQTYGNVFEFARKTYIEMVLKAGAGKQQVEPKQADKKDDKAKRKSLASNVNQKARGQEAEAMEYKEALDLMTECARILHIRWIQGKLAREVIDIVYKPWCTIIREHNNGYIVGLWLTTLRCLEIWDILKTIRKKKYSNPEILRKYVSIVQFYTKRVRAKINVKAHLTAAEANIIDSDVKFLLEEHRISSRLSKEVGAWKMLYVKPELDIQGEDKFHVCFECALRLKENYITCDFCELVSFCNLECLRENIERATNHPCNDFLAEKYLPPPEEISVQNLDSLEVIPKLRSQQKHKSQK